MEGKFLLLSILRLSVAQVLRNQPTIYGEPRGLIKMLSLADLFGYFCIESQRVLCKVLNKKTLNVSQSIRT